jgi:hypothetical protein
MRLAGSKLDEQNMFDLNVVCLASAEAHGITHRRGAQSVGTGGPGRRAPATDVRGPAGTVSVDEQGRVAAVVHARAPPLEDEPRQPKTAFSYLGPTYLGRTVCRLPPTPS